MRAFKLAAGLGRSSTGRSGRRKGSGRAAGGRGGVASSRGGGRAKKVMEDDTSSASDMSSQEHCGAETEEPQCEKIGELLLGRCPRAAPGERTLELWGGGRFAFAEIRSKGIHIGHGVTRGLHVNADGYAAGTPCKKAITGKSLESLELDEIKLRLKRWVAAGLVHPFPEGRQRQSHIALGGKGLEEFRSSGSWGDMGHDDLDALLA